MLRSDFFTLLSVCQSDVIINKPKHQKAIKKGVSMICTRTQDVYMEEIESRMRGWAKPLKDKALNNQLVHMLTINIPDFVRYYKEPGVNPNSPNPKL